VAKIQVFAEFPNAASAKTGFFPKKSLLQNSCAEQGSSLGTSAWVSVFFAVYLPECVFV